MAKSKKTLNSFDGLVYSTDENFVFEQEEEVINTPEPHKQRMSVSLDKKARKGKSVTLVKGFKGRDEDLEELGKELKKYCAVGGSVKDREIVIQGDFRKKIQEFLVARGYNVKFLG